MYIVRHLHTSASPGVVESWESSDYIRPINFFAGTDRDGRTVSHSVPEPLLEEEEKEGGWCRTRKKRRRLLLLLFFTRVRLARYNRPVISGCAPVTRLQRGSQPQNSPALAPRIVVRACVGVEACECGGADLAIKRGNRRCSANKTICGCTRVSARRGPARSRR